MDDRQLARMYALARIGFGVVFLLAPGRTLRPLLGRDVSAAAGVRWLGRTFGARDAVIGAGTLAALQGGAALRPWLHYGATVDAADALATAIAYRRLPRRTRFVMLVLSAAGAATGIALAQRLED